MAGELRQPGDVMREAGADEVRARDIRLDKRVPDRLADLPPGLFNPDAGLERERRTQN
ncbi:MAG TPA: hypothetical protein VL418_15135 [Devosiaceae bacterium]|nr:hypothetical protein [Devosiaceae bacterium]